MESRVDFPEDVVNVHIGSLRGRSCQRDFVWEGTGYKLGETWVCSAILPFVVLEGYFLAHAFLLGNMSPTSAMSSNSSFEPEPSF